MRRHLLAASLLAALFPASAPAEPPVRALDQGWSEADRRWMYGFSQGSRIMPYDWFRALEEPDGERSFRHDGLARFGYLPRPAGQAPDNLPVGFGTEADRRGLWLGMNCTACHTNRVEHGGRLIQVDGAPANADLLGFVRELDRAMRRTLEDPAKFNRFEAGVRRAEGRGGTGTLPDGLREELKVFSEGWSRFADWSTPAHEWGPARADAFNMIFNRVAAIDMARPDNAHPPEAPVSYPFLWNTHGQAWTQWNGMIENDEWFKRLGRNAGQVLGVFGQLPGLASADAFAARGFENSLRGRALLLAEAQYARLRAPSWRDAGLPRLDPTAVARGEQIYASLGCGSCHSARGTLVPVSGPADGGAALSTDPLTARLISTRRVRTGPLEGWTGGLVPAAPLPAEVPAAVLLKVVVSQTLVDWSTWRVGTGLLPPRAGTDGPPAGLAAPALADRVARDSDAAGSAPYGLPPPIAERPIFYKAGPLQGIWATGPFLHNGSVPTLDALLRPAADRPARFRVGGRVLDTERVGFVSDGPEAGDFVFDTALPGNRNTGHEGYRYGTLLEEWQRRDLLEFLKSQ